MRHECPGVGWTFWSSSLMRVPTLARRSWHSDWAAMAGACSLGLLLLLLQAVVTVSLPVIVVRLNKAALDYGKRPANLPPSVLVGAGSE